MYMDLNFDVNVNFASFSRFCKCRIIPVKLKSIRLYKFTHFREKSDFRAHVSYESQYYGSYVPGFLPFVNQVYVFWRK